MVVVVVAVAEASAKGYVTSAIIQLPVELQRGGRRNAFAFGQRSIIRCIDTDTLLGCILFATITNALLVMGVPTTWQNVVYGAILIIALLIDIFKRTKMSKA